MTGRDPEAGRATSVAPLLLAGGLAAVFSLLGLGILLSPERGAALFGIPAGREAAPYVRALAARDLALAIYLGVLALRGDREGLRVVLFGSLVIPLCDLALVLAETGFRHPVSLGLHAASGAVLVLVGALQAKGPRETP